MDRPLRLIPTNQTPAAELARTVEALLVVASQPLTAEEIAGACDVDIDELDAALEILAERYAEGTSGIVLEQVAGGYAFRAAREAADACARLFDRPADKGLSAAALETLAIVAYLGPVSRPGIAQIRGVNVDGVVSGLVERGLISEGGRDNEFGAIRYRTTPLFERVFGIESLAALPRLDDLGADVDEIRCRLEAVAEKRA
jgi:segregation and condensation protein B